MTLVISDFPGKPKQTKLCDFEIAKFSLLRHAGKVFNSQFRLACLLLRFAAADASQ